MFEVNGICYAGEWKSGLKVTSMKVLPGKILMVHFSSGETRLFDVTILTEPVFEPLQNEEILKDFDLSLGFPSWMNGEIDIAPEALYEDGFAYNAPEVTSTTIHAS